MSTLITEMIKQKQTTYKFKPECTGIAGFCPDCNGFVSWNSYHSRFECLSNECCFIANEKGERIWDNAIRDENIKKLKNETRSESKTTNINFSI